MKNRALEFSDRIRTSMAMKSEKAFVFLEDNCEEIWRGQWYFVCLFCVEDFRNLILLLSYLIENIHLYDKHNVAEQID